MATIFFTIMLACFITHELDTVDKKEWRMLPILQSLPEHTAKNLFVFGHIPVFVLVFWGGLSGTDSIITLTLSLFSIVHIGLHWLFCSHPANEFNNIGSWTAILGAGFFGALHLMAQFLAAT